MVPPFNSLLDYHPKPQDFKKGRSKMVDLWGGVPYIYILYMCTYS